MGQKVPRTIAFWLIEKLLIHIYHLAFRFEYLYQFIEEIMLILMVSIFLYDSRWLFEELGIRIHY